MMRQTVRATWLLVLCGLPSGRLGAQAAGQPLVLNEVFSEGDFESGSPDWVELRNTAAGDEPLDGYALQLEGLRPAGDQGRFLFEFPNDLVVPGGGYFLLCFGGEPPARDQRPRDWHPRCETEPMCSASLCLEFGLDADGGVVSLTWKPQCQQVARLPVDAIRYPPLGRGESFGRADGDAWCELTTASPLAANAPCVVNDPQVVINEVVSTGQPSWIELFFKGTGAVSLTGFQLENQESAFTFQRPVILHDGDTDGDSLPDSPPNRFATVFLAGSCVPAPGATCAAFNLKAEGDTLFLRLRDAGQTWDGVSIPRLAPGESYARIPDGGAFCVTSQPTQAAPNPPECADLPPRVALIDRFPLRVHPGDPVQVFARALDPVYTEPPGIADLARVELHWSFDADDPALGVVEGIVMMDHGKRVYCERYEEPGIFVEEIPGQPAEGTITFFARARERDRAGVPGRIVDSDSATARVQPPDFQDPLGLSSHVLRLNEVSANSPAGPGDWVEIFNPTGGLVSLAGLFLVESNIRPLPAEGFRVDLGIAGKSRLVIHLSDALEAPEPRVPILLDDCRDELILLDRDGQTVIDFLQFHEEKIDKTLGRLPDGGDELAVMRPTKGLTNASASCLDFKDPGPAASLVINEYSSDNWHTASDSGGEFGDWIELFNRGDEPVSLDCWSLSDSWDPAFPGGRKRWFFPKGITVPPAIPGEGSGFLLIWCDNDDDCETPRSADPQCWQDGPCEVHTTFQLNRVADFVQLLDPQGRVADFAFVGFQPRDVSAGRFPDGASEARFLEPTPGVANDTLAPGRDQFGQPSCSGRQDLKFSSQQLTEGVVSCVPHFQRGDADFKCRVDITDAVVTLSWLFAGGAASVCDDAADANDDGRVDLSDAIFTLAFLFLGGQEPPAPGPLDSGPDPTDDGLTRCEGEPCEGP